jgi:hypothetical protein
VDHNLLNGNQLCVCLVSRPSGAQDKMSQREAVKFADALEALQHPEVFFKFNGLNDL